MLRVVGTYVLLLIAAGVQASAQPAPEMVIVEVRGGYLTMSNVDLYTVGQNHFLPATDMFDFLGIKNTYDSVQNRITGFFKKTDSTYVIDFENNTASFAKRHLTLTDQDYMLRDTRLFFNLSLFRDLFGIDLLYNPRRLQVLVKNAPDLPVFTVNRLLRSLRNRAQFKKIPEPDLVVGRNYKLIGGGLINWSTNSEFSQSQFTSSRDNLYFGVKTLGGDATGRFFSTFTPMRNEYTFIGNYRYPFFNNSFIRQITVGDHLDFGVISQEITGVEITNRPAALRRLFTHEVFRGNVDPNMDVTFAGSISEAALEHTDQTGSYQFDIPVLYGNGLMEMRAYDAWGQERVMRYRMSVPQTMLPPGEFQYSISLGKNREEKNAPFTSTNTVSWGLTPEVTIGGIGSYYQVKGGQQFFPAITGTGRLLSNLILQTTIFPDAYGVANLDWEFASTARLTATETHYTNVSILNPAGIMNEWTLGGSFPILQRSPSFVFDLSLDRTEFGDHRTDDIQASVNAVISTFSPSLSEDIVFNRDNASGDVVKTVHQSVASLAFVMPAGLNLRTDATYDHVAQSLDNIEILAVKRLSFGLTFSFSYFRFFSTNSYQAGLRLAYYFPFAHVQVSGDNTGTDRYQYQTVGNGTVLFDLTSPSLSFTDGRGNVLGNSGFIVRPYLDENGNGKMDKGEQQLDQGRIYYQNLTVGGYPVSYPVSYANRTRIYSYEDYDIFLDPETLENPTWVPEFSSVKILAEPNYVRHVDIPVENGGIVRGTVNIQGKTLLPAEGINVTITALNETEAQQTATRVFSRIAPTFSTGEFEFIGILPGKYVISIDPAQLADLKLAADVTKLQIEVVSKPEGDLITDQNFTLHSLTEKK